MHGKGGTTHSPSGWLQCTVVNTPEWPLDVPPGPGGPLKYNVVSRGDQGFLKYTINKYFLLEPKYTLNADFMHFLTNFTPE